ncbi:gamma-tubulin complex, DGRIP91/SPC98 component, partial [Macrolepiota fuliginosa MF-IS2]
MSTLSSSLDSLVSLLVPASRSNQRLRQELLAQCQDILNSHIGRGRDNDLSQLVDIVKKHLLQTSGGGADVLRFTNLVSRLFDQPLLTKRQESIAFLHSLASAGAPPTLIPVSLPSLAPPPSRDTATSPISLIDTRPLAQLPPSKAQLLREYRKSRGYTHISERLLLRDALYLLQGISGKYVKISASEENDNRVVFLEDSKNVIPAPTKVLIHRLAELGYLYNRVETFVRQRESASEVGMIEQSLCHYLQAQLTEYYRLIAILETQMSQNEGSQVAVDEAKNNTGLSLRRLDVWINEWRMRMRMMSVCVEGAKKAQGGALVNLIHSYTDNGDPFIRTFTDQLLEEVSRPFFSTLHKWLFSGELYDPFAEFFVAVDSEFGHITSGHPLSGVNDHASGDGGFDRFAAEGEEYSGAREDGLKLWETKYRFRQEMLPLFVGDAFGKKIFSTGKSLNFIRYSCHDSDWVITREKMSNSKGQLQYNDITGLERSIDTAYKIASKRLFEVFIDKFKLLDHLNALRNYLMLGRGDFADQLMETLEPSLARPANTLYRHNLTATLETAIRSSTAQQDPLDVLRRLDARMLEYSHGEIGWDVFTLEYKVDSPIDTVLDSESMEKYLKLFRYLWQLKRVELTLNKGWMRVTSGVRSFLKVPDLSQEWHRIRLTMAEMIHFARQMQAYCRLEVIECSWINLIEFLNKKEGDLDALIEAHRIYLDRMAKKIFLLSPKAGKEENILHQVRELFGIILQFRIAIDQFYNYCLSESSRRDQELDAQRGVHTAAITQQPLTDSLHEILERLKEYQTMFSERLQSTVLHLQVHTDLDCRFLGIRLSFSDYYRAKKE